MNPRMWRPLAMVLAVMAVGQMLVDLHPSRFQHCTYVDANKQYLLRNAGHSAVSLWKT